MRENVGAFLLDGGDSIVLSSAGRIVVTFWAYGVEVDVDKFQADNRFER